MGDSNTTARPSLACDAGELALDATSSSGSGLPVPSRRTFATGILPCAHSTQARFGILPLARLRGRRDSTRCNVFEWVGVARAISPDVRFGHPALRSLHASSLRHPASRSLARPASWHGQPLPLPHTSPRARARGLRKQMPLRRQSTDACWIRGNRSGRGWLCAIHATLSVLFDWLSAWAPPRTSLVPHF